MKVLVEKGQSDPMIGQSDEEVHLPYASALHAWSGPYEGFSWLLRQEHFYIDTKKRSNLNDFTVYALQAASPVSPPEFLSRCSLREELINKTSEEGDSTCISVIGLIFSCFILSIHAHNFEVRQDRVVSKLCVISDLVELGCDIFGEDRYGRSIFEILLTTSKGREWGSITLPAGVDPKKLLYAGACEDRPPSEFDCNCFPPKSHCIPARVADVYEDQERKVYLALEMQRMTEIARHKAFRRWFHILSAAGINLHQYARTIEESHPKRYVLLESEVSASYQCQIIFKFHYGDNTTDLDISWLDIWETNSDYSPVPGAWQEEWQATGTKGLDVLADFCVIHNLALVMDGPSHTYTFTNRCDGSEDCPGYADEPEWEDRSENGENNDPESGMTEGDRAKH